MRYTIRDGAEHPLSGRVKDNLRFLLPLLVILAGVLFFTLGPNGNKNSQKPFTLGIYTVKSNTSPSGNTPDSGNSYDNGLARPSPSAAAGSAPTAGAPVAGSTSAAAGSSSTSPAPNTPSGSIVGGMGGGATTSTGAISIVTCDNTGGILPMTCTTCTPALVVPVGQKVLLSNSGSCSLLN